MSRTNNFVPFDQLVVVVTLMVTTYAAVAAYKMAKWIIGIVRGAGTS